MNHVQFGLAQKMDGKSPLCEICSSFDLLAQKNWGGGGEKLARSLAAWNDTALAECHRVHFHTVSNSTLIC